MIKKSLIILVFALLSMSTKAQVCFSTPVSIIYNGSDAKSVVCKDFNKDGKMDMAVADNGLNYISVFIGNGNGTFASASYYTVISASSYCYPYTIISEDFNGDSIPDIAVGGYSYGTDDSLSVLIGDGLGNFYPSTNFLLGAGTITITCGDFNKDGNMDIAAANWDAANITVLYGDGNGNFSDTSSFYAGVSGWPYSITCADFNNDSIIDLAISLWNTDSISILFGDGNGGFVFGSKIFSDSSPDNIEKADFNEDGNMDLVITSYTNQKVTVFLGNGSGGFSSPFHYYLNNKPRMLTCNDFNGDGKLDIAVASGNSSQISILIGNGLGSFSAPIYFYSDQYTNCITSADFNNDNKIDLLMTPDDIGDLIMLVNNTFLLTTTVNGDTITADQDSASYQWIDCNYFNQSIPGATDQSYTPTVTGSYAVIITKNGCSYTSLCNNIIIEILNSCFDIDTTLAVGTQPTSITCSDFNGDNFADIAITNSFSNNVSIFLGNGAGGFSSAPFFNVGGQQPHSITCADFNGDSIIDLATADYFYPEVVSVYLGNGFGNFSLLNIYDVGIEPTSITSADFNGDHYPDLAVANFGSSSISVLNGDGNGNFFPASNFSVSQHPVSIINADFNKDGKIDIATANCGTSANNVSVLINNGQGGFYPATNFSVGITPMSLTCADFNGDSILDLATANSGSNNLSILLGNGQGGFSTATNILAETSPVSIVSGDLDGDGIIDLATANSSSNNISVFVGDGLGNFSEPSNFAVLNVSSLICADFNHDGKLDIATASGNSNNATVLTNCFLNTEIQELKKNTDISVYPNPNNGVFTVTTNNFVIKMIKIYNVLGEDVYNTSIAEEKASYEMKLFHLPNGIYFIKLCNEKSNVMKKFIKE